MQDIHCVSSMKKVYDEIEYGNVNNAVELLENILKCARINKIKQEKADKMGKKLVPWWDKELQHLKFCRNQALRLYRKFRYNRYLCTYLATRKKFRTLFRNKENSYRDKLFDKLKFSKDDPTKTWQFVKSTSK